MKRQSWYILISVSIVILLIAGLSYMAFCTVMRVETRGRYSGVQNSVSAQLNGTLGGIEMSANNVFNEVEKRLGSPDSAISALESESGLNPDVRGYFAAFEPNYFPEKGIWFEPYIHHNDSSGFTVTQVGSARHDYTSSPWYIRAKKIKMAFWSDPYYYYDGTDISGYYCTYVKPLYTLSGEMACVCGADITFEWLNSELDRIVNRCRYAPQFSKFNFMRDFDFFAVVFYKDGTCLLHPADKTVIIKDEKILKDFDEGNNGIVDMDIDGVPSRMFYGTMENLDWTVAVIAPISDLNKPFIYAGVILGLLVFVGILIVYIICRRIKYA